MENVFWLQQIESWTPFESVNPWLVCKLSLTISPLIASIANNFFYYYYYYYYYLFIQFNYLQFNAITVATYNNTICTANSTKQYNYLLNLRYHLLHYLQNNMITDAIGVSTHFFSKTFFLLIFFQLHSSLQSLNFRKCLASFAVPQK